MSEAAGPDDGAAPGRDEDTARPGYTSGDGELSAAAFERLAPELRRLAAAVAPPGLDSDDLLQEATARVLARIRRSGPVDDPGSYLARTVINLARSRRRGWARRAAASRAVPRLTSATIPEPDEISELLDQLQPRQRACLWLRFVEDRSVSQTAQLLGCSEGTVKSQTSKALRTLRTSAGRPSPDPPPAPPDARPPARPVGVPLRSPEPVRSQPKAGTP